MIIELLIIGASFFLSIFYSASEAAFYSANRLKMTILAKNGAKSARLAIDLIKSPERFLSTILIGNNIANIAFGSIMAVALQPFFNESVVVIVSTSIILVFSEILPKSLARLHPESAAMQAALPIRISEILYAPIIHLLSLVTRLASRFLPQRQTAFLHKLSKEEISMLLKESRFRGYLPSQHEKFIQRIMQLNQVKARQAMIPRTEIYAIEKNTPAEQVRHMFIRHEYTRIPVYDETIDHIIGIVNALDFLHHPESIEQVLRPVSYVPETTPVFTLMRELKQKRVNLVVVIDEYGGTAGILTLEDIFEEIFGEIEDEHDDPGAYVEVLNEKEFRVRGRTEIDYLNDHMRLNLPRGDYETIAGLIIFKLGKIPNVGEILEFPNCRITVTRATRTRIIMVRIHLHLINQPAVTILP